MTKVALREFRKGLSDVTARVQHAGERVVVNRNGKPAFAVVPIEDLKLLQAIEDAIDDHNADALALIFREHGDVEQAGVLRAVG